MSLPTMLRRDPDQVNREPLCAPAPVAVRPLRAAFGPHVSIVSVDSQGQLWVRLSTAVAVLVAGLALMTIPVVAMLWVGDDLVESGRVTLTDSGDSFVPDVSPGTPGAGTRTGSVGELPLAATSDAN